MGQETQKESQLQFSDVCCRAMNLCTGQIRYLVGWTLSAFWCAVRCGPSKWIHTLVLRFPGSHLKKSWWKKMRMSVASLGSWRICKNPLMSNALLEMQKKEGRASPHFIYIRGWQLRLGISCRLKSRQIQSQPSCTCAV